MELYGIAGLYQLAIKIYLYNDPFKEIYHIGLYLLCVMITIVHMEHVTLVNQPLGFLISISLVVKVSVFASKF